MRPKATSSRTLSVEAFVLAWPGNEKSAQFIVKEIRGCVDSVTVLYNSHSVSDAKVPEGWIDLGRDAYFGAKFEHARRVARSDVQIFIPADCYVEDWNKMVTSCRSAFVSFSRAAIWAPQSLGTAWMPNRTALRKLTCRMLSVTAVDSLVWAIRGTFLANLPKMKFATNKYGWGIESAVASGAHLKGFLVLLDTEVSYFHKRGSAYSSNEAELAEIAFWETLPRSILKKVRTIQFIFSKRKLSETQKISVLDQAKLFLAVTDLVIGGMVRWSLRQGLQLKKPT